jgi:hypothetical protein
MVLEPFIELVKFVGGLGGLASSVFLIYDRVLRYRPSAFLIPVDYKTSVRFQNVAAETIIVDEVVIRPPMMLKLARANDLVTRNEERAAALYSSDDRKLDGIFIVIKPTEERTFALHRFADFENADDRTPISIRCRWKNTRKPFPISRYVRIKTTADSTPLRTRKRSRPIGGLSETNRRERNRHISTVGRRYPGCFVVIATHLSFLPVLFYVLCLKGLPLNIASILARLSRLEKALNLDEPSRVSRPRRSSVTLKKNRIAETAALIFRVSAPPDVRCSRKRRTSSDCTASGERPRNAVKSLTLCT